MHDSSICSSMADRLFLFLDRENPLFHQQNALQMTWWTRCWLAALFVGCLKSVVCCTETFVDFVFSSAIFISWIIKDIRNAAHRRLEIKEVFERGDSEPPRSTRHTHILKIITTGKDLRVSRLTCNGGASFRNRYDCWSQWPVQCSQLWSQFLLVWIWISSKVIHHRMSVSDGWVLSLKKSVLSQHSRQSNKYKTEQPFLFRV